MRKRPILLALLLIAVVAVIGLFVTTAFRTGGPEPEYDGKKLSEWVPFLQMVPRPAGRPGRISESEWAEANKKAREAVRQIGPRALPWLLDWISYEPSPRKVALYMAANHILERLNPKWELVDPKPGRADLAVRAFIMLGTNAIGGLEDLERVLGDPKARLGAQRAVEALSRLGAAGVPALGIALTNRQDNVRRAARHQIWVLGGQARAAVPALIPELASKDETAACETCDLLGFLHLEAVAVVPSLAKALEDPRPKVREKAAWALGQFSDEGRPASPNLRRLLIDPDPNLRWAATNALGKVDPQALVNPKEGIEAIP